METLHYILIGVIIFLLIVIFFIGGRVLVINNDSGCKCHEKFNNMESDSYPIKNESQEKLILFYADWCGHCQHMKPDWETAKNMLKVKAPNLIIEEVEHSAPKNDKYPQIKGYPTIMFFKDGKYIEYKGDRSTNSIVDFALQNM